MTQFTKAIRVVVGGLTFWTIYWLVTESQFVAELLRPQVDSGKLGSPAATLLTGLIEVLSAVGGLVLVVVTRGLDYVVNAIEPVVTQLTGAGHSSTQDGADVSDPRQLTDDLSRLLIQSVIEGNRLLTIQLAHRLAKKRFLDGDDEETP